MPYFDVIGGTMPFIKTVGGRDVPLNWERDFVQPTAAVVTEIRAKAQDAKVKLHVVKDQLTELEVRMEDRLHQLRKTSWARILEDDTIPEKLRWRDRLRQWVKDIRDGR